MNFEDKLTEMEKGSSYIDTANKISPVIYFAIEEMKNSFGKYQIEIELLSKELIRKDSMLGVDILIAGVKTFLHFSLAEDICVSGNAIAKEFAFTVIKTAYPELFQKN